MAEVNLGDKVFCKLYNNDNQMLIGYLVDTADNHQLLAISPFTLDEYLKENKRVAHSWVDVKYLTLRHKEDYKPKENKIGFNINP